MAPEPGGEGPLDERIDRVEAWYAARDRPPIFKLTAAADPPDLDGALVARGYATDGETLSMTVAVEDALASRGGEAPVDGRTNVLAGRLDPDWLEASCALSRVAAARRADYRAILERCLAEQRVVLFGAYERGGRTVSVALGSVVEDVVSLVSVATDEASRGRRLAQAVIRGILYAAREHDAERGLLNVEAANGAARRLYGRIGFEERYRYWYRQRRDDEEPEPRATRVRSGPGRPR